MNSPKISKKQKESKSTQLKLTCELYEVINKFSKDSDYNLTYEEINAVLIKLLNDNIQYQLKEVLK